MSLQQKWKEYRLTLDLEASTRLSTVKRIERAFYSGAEAVLLETEGTYNDKPVWAEIDRLKGQK